MIFGRKKDKKQDTETPAAAEDVQVTSGASKPTGQKKRKPAELLSSVVNESTIGASIDILKRNEAFALPNGTAWVGLLLSVDDIGGLSQKQKGDATKGSIIELIAADKIQVVATRAMLDEEFLGIVPTTETLDRMDEYRLLTTARYYWSVFRSEDGDELIADTVNDSTATYAEAVAISRGEKALSEVLPDVWAWGGGISEPSLSVSAPLEPELAVVGASSGSSGSLAPEADSDPLGGAFTFGEDTAVDYAALAEDEGHSEDTEADTDDEPSLNFDESFEAQFTEDNDNDENTDLDTSWQADSEATDEAKTGEEATAGYFQYVEANRDRVVDEQEVRDTIARRFLSSDLDLVVDLAEFDRVFATDAVAISLDIAEDRSDWLGSQVAQLSRQANAELALLHQGHTDDLREKFVQTMAVHLVSDDIPASQFAKLMEGAKKDFEAKRAAAPQEVSTQRREINARFEAAATSRADQASAHARATYEDKNRPKLERDLAEVGLDLDRRHEEQYAHDRQTVLTMRRRDANVRMDLGTNRVFEYLREQQADQREAEQALLARWNAQLSRFIDDNRKNDMARADVLGQQLARENQVEVLKLEHAARLKEIGEERLHVEGRLEQELIRNREEALAQLTSRQTEWNSTLLLERERTRSGSALADQLSAQVEALGAKYEDQYKGRIATLESDKASYALDLDRSHKTQKRANLIVVVLVIVLTLAALLVGVIVGFALNGSLPVAPSGFAVLGSFFTGPTGS